MRCIKGVPRAALTALAPDAPYLAAGSCAVNTSFSASANLEIFGLDFQSDSPDLPVLACAPSPDPFKRIAWSRSATVEGDSFSLGLLAGGLSDGSVAVWNPLSLISSEGQAEDAMVARLQKHTGPVSGLEFSELTPNLLASGADKGGLLIWDFKNPSKPTVYSSLKSAQGGIRSLSWNPKFEHIVAFTSTNGMAVVWDLRNQKPLTSFSESRQCSALQWNPDMYTQLLVASDDDNSPSLKLWDVRKTTSPIREFVGHTKGVIATSWCPYDSLFMISCSKDNRTICWDTVSGEIISELPTRGKGNFDVHWYWKIPGVIITSSDEKIGVHNLEVPKPYTMPSNMCLGVYETSQDNNSYRLEQQKPKRAAVSQKRKKRQQDLLAEAKLEVERAKEAYIRAFERRKEEQKLLQDAKGAIRVYIRVRPVVNANDQQLDLFTCSKEDDTVLKHEKSGETYYFNKVFQECCLQKEIFDEISDLVQSAIDGKKVAIMAYGLSGSGKTHTMFGELRKKENEKINKNAGVIPKALEFIFDQIKDTGHVIKIFISELYLSTHKDLLSNDNRPVIVKDIDTALSQLEKANRQRTTDATRLNSTSSRSHCFVQIEIHNSNNEVGDLLFVDLAVSERSGVGNEKESICDERKTILLYLFYLEQLLRSMATSTPYTGHKTPLNDKLKPYLTVGSKTAILVTLSKDTKDPTRVADSERALTFANEVKSLCLDKYYVPPFEEQ